jgi:transmembrane sensor
MHTMSGDAPLAGSAAEAGSDAIHGAALEWQVTLWSGEVTAEEREAFERWLGADAAHRQAWMRVQCVNEQIRAVPGAIAGTVLRTPKPAGGGLQRRSVLRGVVLLASAGIVGHIVRGTPEWQVAMADQRTARGERRDVVLPDSSRIMLNTATAVDLRFTAHERRIVLRRGEILISTAPDGAASQRPFIVETDQGSIRALGTRFTVRRLEEGGAEQSAVQVFEGAVEIRPLRGGEALRLDAGQQGRFSSVAAGSPAVLEPAADAWSRGLLVAERMRLGDFIAEVGRYRSGVLRCDPAVADLIVSGVYPLQDTDAILQSLTQALPVRVSKATRYWVCVVAPSLLDGTVGVRSPHVFFASAVALFLFRTGNR